MREHILTEEFELVKVERVSNRELAFGQPIATEVINVYLRGLPPLLGYASSALHSAELRLTFDREYEAERFLKTTIGENFTLEMTKYSPNYPEGARDRILVGGFVHSGGASFWHTEDAHDEEVLVYPLTGGENGNDENQ